MATQKSKGVKRSNHLDARGHAHMVDVSHKPITVREATASGCVNVGPKILASILEGQIPKGDVLATARIAGIMAAKQTHLLIPLCHPLPIEAVTIEIEPHELETLLITATCRCTSRTGVEMEALTAVSVAALTIYDMCKSLNKAMVIGPIRLEGKTGGNSGAYQPKI